MKNLLAFLMLTGSLSYPLHAQNYSYTSASKRKGIEVFSEKVTLTIQPVPVQIDKNKEAVAAIAGALLGPLIDLGVSVAKTISDKNVKKYVAEYSCSNSGDEFYKSSNTVNLPALTITREIIIKERKSLVTKTAVKIELAPELSSDHFYFRYAVKNIQLDYSKAKTKNNYDFIDFKIDVTFKTLTLEDEKYELNELRTFTINIPSAKVNTAYSAEGLAKSCWLPFPAAPEHVTSGDNLTRQVKTTKEDYKKYEHIKKTQESYTETTTDTTSIVKNEEITSRDTNHSGTYEFEIKITESNPYKIKAENKQQFIEKNGDTGAKVLKAISDAAFPPKD